MPKPVTAVVATLALSLLTLSTIQIVVAPGAQAENRCGTPAAGAFVNRSSYDISVKGDKRNSDGSYTENTFVNVAPGKTASNYGMCDADFFYPQKAYVMVVGGKYTSYRSAGTEHKIGSGSNSCANNNSSQYPIICKDPGN